MPDCLFCEIAQHRIPAEIVEETENVVAFRDIKPQAPTHVLVIPKAHITSAADIAPNHATLWEQMLSTANRIAVTEGIAKRGYRVVTNVGDDAGQTVHHVHLHLLGGRSMAWPPG